MRFKELAEQFPVPPEEPRRKKPEPDPATIRLDARLKAEGELLNRALERASDLARVRGVEVSSCLAEAFAFVTEEVAIAESKKREDDAVLVAHNLWERNNTLPWHAALEAVAKANEAPEAATYLQRNLEARIFRQALIEANQLARERNVSMASVLPEASKLAVEAVRRLEVAEQELAAAELEAAQHAATEAQFAEVWAKAVPIVLGAQEAAAKAAAGLLTGVKAVLGPRKTIPIYDDKGNIVEAVSIVDDRKGK